MSSGNGEASPNPKLDLANLEARWAYASTHRERSDLEGQMWEIAAPALSKEERKNGAAAWLCKRLEVSEKHTRTRQQLRLSEPDTNVLWDRVDGYERMLLFSATSILSRAKVRAVAESVPLAEAIDRELAEYDTWTMIKTPEGTFRKRPQRVKGYSRADPHVRTVADVATARALWTAFRASVKRVVDHEIRRVGSSRARDRLRSQIEVEIEGAIKMLQSRINRVRDAELSGAGGDSAIAVKVIDSGESVSGACTVLGVDPPEIGQPVDHKLYMAAKKNFKRLVREHHPDQGGARERYEAVVGAMQVIEDVYQAKDSATSSTNPDQDQP